MSYAAESPDPLGFQWEHWFEHVRRAESTRELGSLGGYQLLEEVARGGQGVVFRARELATGRIVAVKRLLAGSFATRPALRRFEREFEAATALAHPGIVSVLRFELAGGSPFLAMEWIDGEPITRWASSRGRDEILARFLDVCDAVQHAHQRGVLHRDLKPSNVLVDGEGRPHVLDFGLAKRSSDAGSTVTESGEFLGTPAYAAPEQWRGEEPDVRADVYSLGALLFEMLTERRVVEGDAIVVMARALERREPPHASALVPSIPRELDAVLAQALANERAARYQSVDALSADVRRFLAREPVLAHTPSTWYQVRKLVARNRAVSVSLGALLLANLVYLGVLLRQSRRLSDERDGALFARNAESAARADAQREAKAAREAEERARRERARSDERATALQLALDLFLGSSANGRNISLFERHRHGNHAASETRVDPRVEIRVHSWLAEALSRTGSPAAENEARLSLELLQARPDVTEAELADAETLLGTILGEKLDNAAAEACLRRALAHREMDPTGEPSRLRATLEKLGAAVAQQDRPEEALAIYERAATLNETDDDRVRSAINRATVLFDMDRREEAFALFDALSREPLSPNWRGRLLFNRGSMLDVVGDAEQAEQCFVESLALSEQSLGPDHPEVAQPAIGLAHSLRKRGEYRAAVEHAERAERILRLYPASAVLAHALLAKGVALRGLALPLEARSALEEAMTIFRKVVGTGLEWEGSATYLAETFVDLEQLDEAEALLADLAGFWRTPEGDPVNSNRYAWRATVRARIAGKRGEQERAIELFEESIQLYSDLADDQGMADASQSFAEFLRSIGDVDSAAELEAEATRIRERPGR